MILAQGMSWPEGAALRKPSGMRREEKVRGGGTQIFRWIWVDG